jgi:flagellar M-ring protein FliF
VQVNADFDFNRITQTSDKFDPDGRVIRSSQTREESNSNGENNQQVTVGNELPGANQKPTADTAPRDQSRKSEEIVNYEISRTTKTEVIEGGRVNRLSVAVLVDGTYGKDDKGDITYQPRSKDELDQIGTLVRSAIGFDQKRGDQVDVVNLRFAETPTMIIPQPTGWLETMHFTKDDIMRAIEMAVMGVLGLVVLLFVVRPLVRRIVTAEEPKLMHNGMEVIPGTVGALAASGDIDPSKAGEPSMAAKMIDIAQIQGQVHAQSVKKVGELADKNPEETVAIIRHWLHEMPAA